jgi:hypothetical protein
MSSKKKSKGKAYKKKVDDEKLAQANSRTSVA